MFNFYLLLMKKYLFLFIIIVFGAYTLGVDAQESKCVENYAFKTFKAKNESVNIDDVVIEWDFADNEGVSLIIEIQTIDDCWNELEGKNRFALERHDLDVVKSSKGSLKIEHLGINAKCFKWRAVITRNSCEEHTSWQFETF
jgi:hypothetical protein